MGDWWSISQWLEQPAPPPMTYGECMDKLFEYWCMTDDARTFEEFIERSTPGSESE